MAACRSAAQQLAEQLQGVYLLDKKASETVRAGILEALGLLVEVAPQVCLATVQPQPPRVQLRAALRGHSTTVTLVCMDTILGGGPQAVKTLSYPASTSRSGLTTQVHRLRTAVLGKHSTL